MARLIAFAGVIVLLALGYYTYTLRNDLEATRASAWQQNSQAESWRVKYEAAEKTAATDAATIQTCQQTASDLKAQLDTAQAAAMAKGHHKS
jgi:hypothetical protein